MKPYRLFIDWTLNISTGGGCYARNLMNHIALNNYSEDKPKFDLSIIDKNPVRNDISAFPAYEHALIKQLHENSSIIYQKILSTFEQAQIQNMMTKIKLPGAFISHLFNDLSFNSLLTADYTCGLSFIESTEYPKDKLPALLNLDCLYAGSSWNEDVLKAHGCKRTKLLLQGIDPAYFHPGPPLEFFSDRFCVFSGGKAEHRKGQDIVIKAFRAFCQTRPDALLVTAWHTIGSSVKLAHDLAERAGLATIQEESTENLNINRWLHDNGIPEDQYIDLGFMANDRLPLIYRSMNIGLFPNRCEAGTNLVAMEAMACAMPIILSKNTGHLDIVQEKSQLALNDQSPVHGSSANFLGTDGWGESSVDEVIARLEWAYDHRQELIIEGKNNATFMKTLTWKNQIGILLDDISLHIGKDT